MAFFRQPVGEALDVSLLNGRSARVTVQTHVRSSGCSMVFRGQMDHGLHVAIKSPAGSSPISRDLMQRELRSWRSAQHPYILPLLAFRDGNDTAPLLLVTPWMSNGTLTDYLRLFPSADRRRFAHQIAEGLTYLHAVAMIVHGDLKGDNIFVSETGDALVADFGLSTLVNKNEDDATTASAIRELSTLVYSAPELLVDRVFDEDGGSSQWSGSQSQHRKRSKSLKTDVFAYGMVLLEIFTGTIPWSHVRDRKQRYKKMLLGTEHPHPGDEARSRGLDENMWRLCRLCWSSEPAQRPNMEHIATVLRYHSHSLSLPTPWSVSGSWEYAYGQMLWIPRCDSPQPQPDHTHQVAPPCRAESCSPRLLTFRRAESNWATLAWRDAQEADFLGSGRTRRRRPGVTFDASAAEDAPLMRALLSPRSSPRVISLSRSSVRSPASRRRMRATVASDGHDADVE